jgi:hypothetical protein
LSKGDKLARSFAFLLARYLVLMRATARSFLLLVHTGPCGHPKLRRDLSRAGASQTVIIATVSPSVLAVDETISTLNYAQAAHGIQVGLMPMALPVHPARTGGARALEGLRWHERPWC